MTHIELTTFLSILSIYFIVIAVPGPNMLVVARYTLGGNWKAALIAAVGIAVGATINASITMFGAAAIVVKYPIVMVFVALIGGSVLIFLAYECLQSALTTRRTARQAANSTAGKDMLDRLSDPMGGAQPPDHQPHQGNVYTGAFMRGVWVNVSNPKGIAFFLVLYAPLIAGATKTFKFTVLGTCFLLELIWFSFLISVLSRSGIRRFFAQNALLFDLVMAVVLFILGFGILLDLPEYLAQRSR